MGFGRMGSCFVGGIALIAKVKNENRIISF
jgi:hypothetical protein